MSILAWIVESFTSQQSVQMGKFSYLLSHMETILKTRGKTGLVNFCKLTRLALLHSLSGEFPGKKVSGVPVFKDGIPKALGAQLADCIRKDTTRIYLRLVLTVLYATRALSLGKDPDIQTIISPPKREASFDISEYRVQFWKDLGYRPSKNWVPRGVYWKDFHMTTKSGPNGHALWCSMVDFKLVAENFTLFSNLKVLGGKKFSDLVDLLASVFKVLPPSVYPVVGSTLRRLSWFPDMEQKVRVVAILDYWSQTVLRGFHLYLFKVLRKIPQDCTFDQGSFLEKTKTWEYYYSLDLTAATDRFPISIISMVLSGLLPESFVKSWEYVMIGLPFDYKKGKLTDKVSYLTGNPMGAYSSWNSFAIAHHYVMYWCCKKLNIPWKDSKYVLLGDDVLIGDHRLAELYLDTMSRLGVEISDIKSHRSSKLFEFAKRLVLNGTEITPFPISALNETSKRFYLLVTLLMQEQKKGWTWSCGIPSTVDGFYSRVLKANSKFAARLSKRALLSETMMLIMAGALQANDGLNTIIKLWKLQLPTLTPDQGISILSGTAVECFAEENPLDRPGDPIGVLAEKITMEVLGVDSPSIEAVAPDLPSSIPLLNVYGQVCEKWLEIQKQAYLIDTIGKGEWPMHLRTLALPLSDKVFSERASYTIARVGAILGDKVLKNLCNLRYSDF